MCPLPPGRSASTRVLRMTGFDVYERLARLNEAHKRDVARWTDQYLRSKAIADRNGNRQDGETRLGPKDESGGSQSEIAPTTSSIAPKGCV
jgi:hypothetical protein